MKGGKKVGERGRAGERGGMGKEEGWGRRRGMDGEGKVVVGMSEGKRRNIKANVEESLRESSSLRELLVARLFTIVHSTVYTPLSEQLNLKCSS